MLLSVSICRLHNALVEVWSAAGQHVLLLR
jgi:hypothetical protein